MILTDDTATSHGNVHRTVWLLVAACLHHYDLVGDRFKVVEEPVDVVLDVAYDHTERQFVFHICAGIQAAFLLLARQNKTATPVSRDGGE